MRWLAYDDHAILLDLARGHYIGLDNAAARIWMQLAAGVPPGDIADADGFAGQCTSAGLFSPCPATLNFALTPTRRFPAMPVTWLAWQCLRAASAALAAHGFGATYRAYSRVQAGHVPQPAQSLLNAFQRAEIFHPVPRAPLDCLPRSLALLHFLRLSGVAADHVIGVARDPFRAHAWVECDRRPINERRDLFRHFQPLARLAV